MNAPEFIKQLRLAGQLLVPEMRKRSEGAASWHQTLTFTADLLEAQGVEPNPEQIRVISKLLFGGLGSFIDYHAAQHVDDSGTWTKDSDFSEINDELLALANAMGRSLEG